MIITDTETIRITIPTTKSEIMAAGDITDIITANDMAAGCSITASCASWFSP
jgi:hypothetical protein